MKESDIPNEIKPEEKENLYLLIEKINNLSSELKQWKEENRRLREILNVFRKRDEKLRKRLTRLLDKIEKIF